MVQDIQKYREMGDFMICKKIINQINHYMDHYMKHNKNMYMRLPWTTYLFFFLGAKDYISIDEYLLSLAFLLYLHIVSP